MTDKDVHTFRGLGLEINFPFEPYGIQKNMMNRVTSTLINKEHSLIESPTGTGKTLVLLCSTLAWQKKSKAMGTPFLSSKLKKAIAAERREKLMNKPCKCGRRPNRTELDELKEQKENSKKKKKFDSCEDNYFDDIKKDLVEKGDPDATQIIGDSQKKHDPDATQIIGDYRKDLARKFDPDATQILGVPDSPIVKKMKRDLMLEDFDDLKEEDFNDTSDKKTTYCQTTQTAAFTSSKYFSKTKPNDTDIIIIDDEFDDDACCAKAANDECQIIKSETKPEVTKSKPSSGEEDNKNYCISCAAIDAEDKFSEIFGEDSADTDAFISTKIKAKIPRIYYGTRTHKQITQVIRELNKTPYKRDLKMCILSSRERTCINDDVKDATNRNDLCRDLLKSNKSQENSFKKSKKKEATGGCPFYRDSNSAGAIFEEINTEFEDKAWDIEDAASYGLKNSTCPYFGVRSLQGQADITFSPYNYLLDPTIRKTLDINLSNAIVIFDEAHNIEDICRESASFNIDTNQIDEILETINIASGFLMQGSVVMDSYQFFRDKLLNLKSYLLKYPFFGEPEKYSDYLHKKILTKKDMLETLTSLGLGADNMARVKDNLKALRGDDEEGEKPSSDAQESALSFAQMQFISQLVITLDFIYATGNKYVDDFRCVITKSLEREFNRPRGGNRNNQNNDVGPRHIWQFSLVCMNPGIAFEKIHSLAWSVIVASGTLSPIESLKTELGCQFTNVFEGAHVIKAERIFASIVSRGPTRVDLDCAWKNSLKLEFQDEVGKVIRDICTTVPHGVLCFFPSYDRMENFYQRWFQIGIIKDIQKVGKKLYREQKKMTAANFESELQKYNRNARGSGAVLFAVFRGKVSEGIDFADEAARAVITIGIPYPNIKETNVGLKREYNDVARRSKPHLMTGGDWYASQAFRALNQALGRCIRHKEDWGAIIMIDSRLKQTNSLTSISKWLSRNVQITDNYSMMRQGLQEFVNMRTAAVSNTNANQQVIELNVD